MRCAWTWLLSALMLAGCAHHQERKVRRSARQLGKAVARGDEEAVLESAVVGVRSHVDLDALHEDSAGRKRWGRALARPEQTRVEALVFLAPDYPVTVVLTEQGWRFAEDPTDVYAQGTPRQALRSLVWATKMKRWDVLVALAPKRYRMGMTARDLATAWTEGEYAQVLQAARDEVAAHLADPVVSDAHEAVLRIDEDHVVRLEREGDRWVIVDFLPASGAG